MSRRVAHMAGVILLSALSLINAAGWALLLSIYVPAVHALYDRGYGSIGAIVGFIAVPSAMALISVIGPTWLVRRNRTGGATAIAGVSFLLLLFAFMITAALLSI